MNIKLLKTLRKYARLRGAGEPALSEKNLRRVYENAAPSMQEYYRKEMSAYFKAIDAGSIDPGESMLYAVLNRNESYTE